MEFLREIEEDDEADNLIEKLYKRNPDDMEFEWKRWNELQKKETVKKKIKKRKLIKCNPTISVC